MMVDKNSAVILARVSSKSQEDEGYSLESQVKFLTQYSEANNFNVKKIFSFTETASKEQDRKVFHEIVEYLYKEKIYHLAVEKTDRLTRNLKDAVLIDDWLHSDEERILHAVKESLRVSKNARSEVKFMWSIHLAVAKKYADNLREEAMKGWAEKLAQGWLPGSPPPGYMTVNLSGKKIHVPDPEQAPLMRRVFRKYLEPNETIMSIVDEMGRLGFKTRNNKPYGKTQVQRILNNPFYMGVIKFDGKEYPGAHEPIISKATFNRAQAKMHRNRPIKFILHNRPLKNMIRCEDCGTIVTWQLQKGRYYGICKRRSPSCKYTKMLREEDVEKQIMDLLKNLVNPSQEVIDWFIENVKDKYKYSNIEREKTLVAIKSQLTRIDRMLDQLYDDKLSGDISKEKYESKRNELTIQKKALEDQEKRAGETTEKQLHNRITLLKLSQKASEIYDSRTPDQKRLILSKLFKNISLKGGSISVEYTNFTYAIAQNVFKTKQILMEV
jgi:DNA invertase Pin-like site-specific DNA recombinase